MFCLNDTICVVNYFLFHQLRFFLLPAIKPSVAGSV